MTQKTHKKYFTREKVFQSESVPKMNAQLLRSAENHPIHCGELIIDDLDTGTYTQARESAGPSSSFIPTKESGAATVPNLLGSL